jgi:SAM-dependent methyltransferase
LEFGEKMKIEDFKAHLDSLTYDKYYQDITCIGYTGYSESSKTWERIKDEVPWKDKLVADLGCFHGYFSFQIAKAGGKVTGCDKSSTVIKTTDIINELEGNLITTRVWEDSQPITEKYDVVLCLNALHHFSNPENFLETIDCDIAVFEINADMEPLIEKYFAINKRIESHRENRIILIARKCRPLPDKRFKENKLFVTGIYAGGKSDYARSYANKYDIPYINFDINFSYDKKRVPTSEDVVFSLFKDTYIIDAIPFSLITGSTKRFFKYAKTHDVRIVCCVCSDEETWKQRLVDAKQASVDDSKYEHYYTFYYDILPIYSEFKIDYFDTFTNEYITKEEMYTRIDWVCNKGKK